MNARDQEIRQKDRQAERDAIICGIYNAIETGEPDISTERLLESTACVAHCEIDRVISALRRHKA